MLEAFSISLFKIILALGIFFLLWDSYENGNFYEDMRIRKWAAKKGFKLISYEKFLFDESNQNSQDVAWTAHIANSLPSGGNYYRGHSALMNVRYRIIVEDAAGKTRIGILRFQAGWWRDLKNIYVVWDDKSV